MALFGYHNKLRCYFSISRSIFFTDRNSNIAFKTINVCMLPARLKVSLCEAVTYLTTSILQPFSSHTPTVSCISTHVMCMYIRATIFLVPRVCTSVLSLDCNVAYDPSHNRARTIDYLQSFNSLGPIATKVVTFFCNPEVLHNEKT